METNPLDQIEYHLSQAMLLLHQCRSGGAEPLPPALATHVARKPVGNNKSLREWVAWLKRNKPSYRQDIWDATGMNLTARKSMVLDWTTDMSHWPDGQMPADTLCRMRGPATGPGAPPSIYFLWSQRFDVHALHGVGPSVRPDPTEPPVETVLGVVHPPVEEPTDPTVTDDTEPTLAWPDPVTGYETMEQWHAHWDSVLEPLALIDAKPTDEEMEEILATLPADLTDSPKAIFAVEYNKARRRAEAARDAAGLDWG